MRGSRSEIQDKPSNDDHKALTYLIVVIGTLFSYISVEKGMI